MDNTILNTDTSVIDNSRTDPLDQLIKDYTMGQPGEAQQAANAEAFKMPSAVGATSPGGTGASALANTAGNMIERGQKQQKQGEIIANEKVQNEKLHKIHQEIGTQVQQILQDTSANKISYDDAIIKLGSLNIKASLLGLHAGDVIENTQNQLRAVSNMHETRQAREQKQVMASMELSEAQKTIDQSKPKDWNGTVDLQSAAWKDSTGKQRIYRDDVKTIIAGMKVDDYEKTHKGTAMAKQLNDIQKNLKSEMDNVAKEKLNKNRKDTPEQANADIKRLVNNGMDIDDAFNYVVKLQQPSMFDNVKAFFGGEQATPHYEWTKEQVLGSDLTNLTQVSKEWENARNQYTNFIQFGKPMGELPAPASTTGGTSITSAEFEQRVKDNMKKFNKSDVEVRSALNKKYTIKG